jgi:hypothetical protein
MNKPQKIITQNRKRLAPRRNGLRKKSGYLGNHAKKSLSLGFKKNNIDFLCGLCVFARNILAV